MCLSLITHPHVVPSSEHKLIIFDAYRELFTLMSYDLNENNVSRAAADTEQHVVYVQCGTLQNGTRVTRRRQIVE